MVSSSASQLFFAKGGIGRLVNRELFHRRCPKMPEEPLVCQSNDALRDTRAEFAIEVYQRTGSAEQVLEALLLGAVCFARKRQLARNEFQCVDRNSNLEG
jgi:hypothetical protein